MGNIDAIPEFGKAITGFEDRNDYAMPCPACGETYPINPIGDDPSDFSKLWRCNSCGALFYPVDSLRFHKGTIFVTAREY